MMAIVSYVRSRRAVPAWRQRGLLRAEVMPHRGVGSARGARTPVDDATPHVSSGTVIGTLICENRI